MRTRNKFFLVVGGLTVAAVAVMHAASGQRETKATVDLGPAPVLPGNRLAADKPMDEQDERQAATRPIRSKLDEGKVQTSLVPKADEVFAKSNAIDLAGHSSIAALYADLEARAQNGDAHSTHRLAMLLASCRGAGLPAEESVGTTQLIRDIAAVCASLPPRQSEYAKILGELSENAAASGVRDAILDQVRFPPLDVWAAGAGSAAHERWIQTIRGRLEVLVTAGDRDALAVLGETYCCLASASTDRDRGRRLLIAYLEQNPERGIRRSRAEDLVARL